MTLNLKVHCQACNNALQIWYILDHSTLLEHEKLVEDSQIHFPLSIRKTISCCKTVLSCLIDDNYIPNDCKMFKTRWL